ncbi:hypothetical protein SAMN05444165_0393 [Paraburkholderia phenazinium]|uniref:Uncharacterized protein n=1 Tax=Paraburkholderia phenazinium TaxID=60549 RepID=A0A1N6FU06_9BURK|nr:hypothetical protein SAMN05444165_0393 [Paraburkholderia phenazinium]
MQQARKRTTVNQPRWTTSISVSPRSAKNLGGRVIHRRRHASVWKCRCEALLAYCVRCRVNSRLFQQLDKLPVGQALPSYPITYQSVRQAFPATGGLLRLERLIVHLWSSRPLALPACQRRDSARWQSELPSNPRSGWRYDDSVRTILNTLAGVTTYPDLTDDLAQHTKLTLLHVYEQPSPQRAMVETGRPWVKFGPHSARTSAVAPGGCAGVPVATQEIPKEAPNPNCGRTSGCLWRKSHPDADPLDCVWALATFQCTKNNERSNVRFWSAFQRLKTNTPQVLRRRTRTQR